jgi:hypothetical protein
MERLAARRKPNGFACLFRVAVGLHLHNLAIVNRVDIGNVAFSHLAASLWPRLKMHEDNKLVPHFEDLFGQALDFLRSFIGASEILSDPLGPPIGSSRVEAFGLAPENIWVQVNSLNCALDVTSTERVICASKAVNDVLIHPCFSFFLYLILSVYEAESKRHKKKDMLTA